MMFFFFIFKEGWIYDVLDVKFLELLKIHIEHNKTCEITILCFKGDSFYFLFLKDIFFKV